MSNQKYIEGMGIYCEECGEYVYSKAAWMQHMQDGHPGTTLDDWQFQTPMDDDGMVYPLATVASGRLCKQAAA